MVYLEVALVVGILLVMLTLLYYSSLVIYGMVVEQSSVTYLLVLVQKLQSKLNLVYSKSLVINQRKNKVLYKLQSAFFIFK
jgi:hypothetical protein